MFYLCVTLEMLKEMHALLERNVLEKVERGEEKGHKSDKKKENHSWTEHFNDKIAPNVRTKCTFTAQYMGQTRWQKSNKMCSDTAFGHMKHMKLSLNSMAHVVLG